MVNTKEYSCTPYCTISKINKKSLLSQFRDSDFSNYANNLSKDQGNHHKQDSNFFPRKIKFSNFHTSITGPGGKWVFSNF